MRLYPTPSTPVSTLYTHTCVAHFIQAGMRSYHTPSAASSLHLTLVLRGGVGGGDGGGGVENASNQELTSVMRREKGRRKWRQPK